MKWPIFIASNYGWNRTQLHTMLRRQSHPQARVLIKLADKALNRYQPVANRKRKHLANRGRLRAAATKPPLKSTHAPSYWHPTRPYLAFHTAIRGTCTYSTNVSCRLHVRGAPLPLMDPVSVRCRWIIGVWRIDRPDGSATDIKAREPSLK